MAPSTKGLAVRHGIRVSSSAVTGDEPTLKRLAGLYVFRYPIVQVVYEGRRAATTELTENIDLAYTRVQVCTTVQNFDSLENRS